MEEMKALKDRLSEWKKQSNQAKKKNKKNGKLTIRDIEELIGIRGLRYESSRGPLRQNN